MGLEILSACQAHLFFFSCFLGYFRYLVGGGGGCCRLRRVQRRRVEYAEPSPLLLGVA